MSWETGSERVRELVSKVAKLLISKL